MKRNVVLITLDGLRPDRLSCYGYDKIRTANIDDIAKEGVLFETCIAPSNFTPICHASILTGVTPNRHGLRNPYGFIGSTTIAEVMRENGYKTAGFTSVDFLGPKQGFDRGFDLLDEPKENEEAYKTDSRYPDPDHDERFVSGNWWIDRMLSWVKKNSSEKFFVWGHFMYTNPVSPRSAEWLLERGLIEEGKLSENDYYDARIKLADERLFGGVVSALKDCGVYDDTILVIMSDHGLTLDDLHPPINIPWKPREKQLPQHMTFYDPDVKVVLIIKEAHLSRGRRIRGMVRSIDVTPTVLDLLGISIRGRIDGKSLVSDIERGESRGSIGYLENLFKARGQGLMQGIRTDDYKYIRDRGTGKEELYDLAKDPRELTNIVDEASESERRFLKETRKFTDEVLWTF